MLRLSKKTDYALIALKDLAAGPTGASSSAREIAARYDIPVELMAKVLQRLAKSGVLASHQGNARRLPSRPPRNADLRRGCRAGRGRARNGDGLLRR